MAGRRRHALAAAFAVAACDQRPDTNVVLENEYAAAVPRPQVCYRASWTTTAFDASVPLPAGSTSAPESVFPCSANTAYVVLAPGWDPTSPTPPTSFVVLQSKAGFGVHLNDTLHIPVDDTTFAGNCAVGSFLTQPQADFITQLVFPDVFATLHYDAATCTVTPLGDAGSP